MDINISLYQQLFRKYIQIVKEHDCQVSLKLFYTTGPCVLFISACVILQKDICMREFILMEMETDTTEVLQVRNHLIKSG